MATETNDLLIVREYVEGDVKVLVKIDRVAKKVSLVERNGQSYVNKKWLFADSGSNRVDLWRKILVVIDKALLEAQKELKEE